MRYISYACRLDYDDSTSQLMHLRSFLSKLENLEDQRSEVLFTCKDLSGLQNIESFVADLILRNTTVSILTSDKRSKGFTDTTLVLDAFIGDYLIYANDISHLDELPDHTLSDEHLIWIKSTVDAKDSAYYKHLNKEFNDTVIPADTVGFKISRQVANYVDSSEFDYYDVFTALAISTYSANASTVSVRSSRYTSRYSDSDILELKTKFLKTALHEYIERKSLTLAELIFSILFASLACIYSNTILACMSILSLILAVSDLILAHNENVIILQRQSLAAANKKRISGNFIKTVINKKRC